MSDPVTRAEFDALESRVDQLEEQVAELQAESGIPPEPPQPTPAPTPPPQPTEPPVTGGIQAKRVASLIEMFGVNTFSSMDTGNSWGSWPADYSPDSTIAALRYLVGHSGFTLPIREYHYAGRYDMQDQWLGAILSVFPDTKITLCPGANATAADVPTMAQLPHTYLEGLNEPNTDFGSGEVPFRTTMDIQHEVWNHRQNNNIMGPSIVAGTPHPEGWITGYCGTPENLAALNAESDFGNGHYYPPSSPDVPATGYSVNEYIGGLWTAYGQHAIHLTEFHPTLYNSRGHKPDQPGWNGERDAYYTLCTLFRCGKNGTQGLWWYALFDYGSVYQCGLFPQHYDEDPRPTADAIRNLCDICADVGDRHGFEPDKLDVVVSGLTPAMDFDVYQASNGRFLIPLWYAAEEIDAGDAVAVELDFGSRKTQVNVYDPIEDADQPVEIFDQVTKLSLTVTSGALVIEVRP